MDGSANLDHLPDDPALLKGIVRELLATHHAQQRQIDQLTHRLDLLLKRVYGPRADKLDPNQLSLFDEPPVDSLPVAAPLPEPETMTTTTKKNGHGRGKLPEHLRRETEIIDVPQSVKQATGGAWQQIGEEISEKLDYTPSSLFVRRIVRPKYVVRFPDKNQPDELRIAELPPEALPKSKAAPGLVADVIVSKLVDHLPLYRQEQRYARQGFSIARSTLCGWLAEAADVLMPLWQVLKERVLAADIVNTDDTPVPVQDPDREHCRTGRIWVYVSRHGTVYDATEDRSRDGPLAFLKDFRGYLQCDAYSGYDELFRRSQGTVIEVGCWAHARRKFVDAEKTSPREAHEAVARIKQLYAVEHQTKELDAAARLVLRQEKAVPLPRLIFVSDMGDAFSRKQDFEFLRSEMTAFQTPEGQRHLWLWLTKRPDVMRQFVDGIGGFPANVCAMTTVTSAKTLSRVDALREVNAAVRGLSLEPLWEPLADKIDLTGIDWVIVGGESGAKANVELFPVEWAIELRDRCREEGVAFFLKQLGRRPSHQGKEFKLRHQHGGDWSEWTRGLRVREMPEYFYSYANQIVQA